MWAPLSVIRICISSKECFYYLTHKLSISNTDKIYLYHQLFAHEYLSRRMSIDHRNLEYKFIFIRDDID